MKTIEDYFQQSVTPPGTEQQKESLSESERAFLEKYVGVDWQNTLTAKNLSKPVLAEQVLAVAPMDEAAGSTGGQKVSALNGTAKNLEEALMAEPELRLVGFHVADQVFAVPIMMVQEVLRAVPVTQLPGAPDFLAGVTNLRGRVTPLVDLARMLGITVPAGEVDNFLIVCRIDDMQIGLQVRAIDTMHRAPQGDIEWGIEIQVGVAADLLAGLLKVDDRLIKILSVSRLFQMVLKS